MKILAGYAYTLGLCLGADPLLERKKLEGFRSRCSTCFSWIYFSANTACASHRRI